MGHPMRGATAITGFGMTPHSLFGKHQFTIYSDFKTTAAGRHERPTAHECFDFTFTQNFVRQTDGAAGVVSNRAVFNLNFKYCELHDITSL